MVSMYLMFGSELILMRSICKGLTVERHVVLDSISNGFPLRSNSLYLNESL